MSVQLQESFLQQLANLPRFTCAQFLTYMCQVVVIYQFQDPILKFQGQQINLLSVTTLCPAGDVVTMEMGCDISDSLTSVTTVCNAEYVVTMETARDISVIELLVVTLQ